MFVISFLFFLSIQLIPPDLSICGGFPPRKVNQYGRPELPSSKLTQPLWPTPLTNLNFVLLPNQPPPPPLPSLPPTNSFAHLAHLKYPPPSSLFPLSLKKPRWFWLVHSHPVMLKKAILHYHMFCVTFKGFSDKFNLFSILADSLPQHTF